MMKAIVVRAWSGLEALQFENVETPVPGAGEVRIAIDIAPLNLGDAIVATGRYQVKPPLPFVPGGECVGVIDALGADVAGYAVGDRVFAIGFKGRQTEAATPLGSFAEYATVPIANVAKIPFGMSNAQAAMFRANYETAYFALVQAGHVATGETVLVLGAGGGVGYACIATARALGARVIASTSSPQRAAIARDAGADEIVDSNDPAWRAKIDALTSGHGLDIVCDPVGGRYTDLAFRALGIGGRHLVIGFAAGDIPSFKTNLPLLKGASLVGANYMRFSDAEPAKADTNRKILLNLFASGLLKLPKIARSYPLDRAREALQDLATAQHLGRYVLDISGRLHA